MFLVLSIFSSEIITRVASSFHLVSPITCVTTYLPVLVVTLLTGCVSTPGALQPVSSPIVPALRMIYLGRDNYTIMWQLAAGTSRQQGHCWDLQTAARIELQRSLEGSLRSVHYYKLTLAVIRSKLHVWISH